MVYIKTITIQGFKSYRDQTPIGPLAPGHCVIVGRNGSGKSNFFSAIRFVLSDAYVSMNTEERQSLLHEGASTISTMTAYVEIVFDNSDNRFPTGNKELIIRRTIGVKKDDYSLDKKTATRGDVMSLLESAGFSKSNPYYIVPQGRITSLTNAKDHERLALLKEVAGTRVYEERRGESLRIMEETTAKRTKISELLEYIEERLNELEEEKKELKEYQEKDKDRRCLEYALYQKEVEDLGQALDEIEEERRQDVHNANVKRDEFNAREKQIENVEARITAAKQRLAVLSLSKHGYSSELSDSIRARTELECVIEDLKESGERGKLKLQQAEAELQTVIKRIAVVERELKTDVLPAWEKKRKEEREESRAMEESQARLQALYSKQGRLSQFKSKAERDKYLRDEIKTIKAVQQDQKANAEEMRRKLASAQSQSKQLGERYEEVIKNEEERKERVRALGDQASEWKEKSETLRTQQRDLWREDAKLESSTQHARDQLRSADRNLASMMDKDTGRGLAAVDEITRRLRLTGVYGPLYRLFEVPDPKYNTAVEMTAGNSLFNIVVDNEDTAARVVEIMTKERTGRLTFIPLNRIKPQDSTFPQAPDAIPLIDKLRFDPKHEKAFKQVFGKTLVCKDLTIAAAYVRSHDLHTITLDGDRVDRKGAMTGGYHDERRSRLEGIKGVKTWSERHESEKAKLADIKTQVKNVEQEITEAVGKMQALQAQRTQAQTAKSLSAKEAEQVLNEHSAIKERIARLESELADLENDLGTYAAKLEAYETELGTEMRNAMTQQELTLIKNLEKEVDARKKKLLDLSKAKNELGGRKGSLEIELNESLLRRRSELRAKIESIGLQDAGADATGNSAEDLEQRQRELKTLTASIEALSKKSKEVDAESEKLTAEVQESTSELEALQAKQTEDSRGISKQQKGMDRYLAKKQLLEARKEERSRNIRDLGVLPEEAFEKYTRERLDRLVKKLQAVNESLKKFAHVNKKAFEQYSNFTKQRDQLLKRRDDLDSSAKSIEELVEVLDQRKDEAIERTFKQVASNFEEVFEKLVPAGRGRLVIQRKIDLDEEADDEDDQPKSSIDNYTGVSIKVSFNSKVDEGLRIQQLSGGQKSLVALATVFAIQKCDPAPFYLFDEIDANLDAQYRTAVAAMIHELSSTAQFITTTFRPEMLTTADQFYGVVFDNQKVSHIKSISRDDARQFVEVTT